MNWPEAFVYSILILSVSIVILGTVFSIFQDEKEEREKSPPPPRPEDFQ